MSRKKAAKEQTGDSTGDDIKAQVAHLAAEEKRRERRTSAQYAVYLQSPHWLAIREWAKQRAQYKCLICNMGGKLHVHHRTYERVGCELPDDLVVLCEDCHNKFHADKSKDAEEDNEQSQNETKPEPPSHDWWP